MTVSIHSENHLREFFNNKSENIQTGQVSYSGHTYTYSSEERDTIEISNLGIANFEIISKQAKLSWGYSDSDIVLYSTHSVENPDTSQGIPYRNSEITIILKKILPTEPEALAGEENLFKRSIIFFRKIANFMNNL